MKCPYCNCDMLLLYDYGNNVTGVETWQCIGCGYIQECITTYDYTTTSNKC